MFADVNESQQSSSFVLFIGCSLKIIQLLQHYEHLTTHLAVAVGVFVEEFGVKSIVANVMR